MTLPDPLARETAEAWANWQAHWSGYSPSHAVETEAPTEEKCANCRFWNAVKGGSCVRRSPRLGRNGMGAKWPNTAESDWCGEWKAEA